MATNSTNPSLPNPFTPLAFLPPKIAEQFQASAYMFVGTMAAYIWDWLMTIPDEIQMCQRRKVRPALITYFISRVGTLGFVISAVILQGGSVADCNTISYATSAFLIVAVSSNGSLFFFRVKAVYRNNKIITAFFGFLLLALFGVSFVCIHSVKSGTTHRCINYRVESYASLPIIFNAVFSTSVFIAISLRVVSFSIKGSGFRARAMSFLRGDGLPRLSKSLLKDGQLYYSVTIGLNIAVVALVYIDVPPIYHAMFAIPSIALESAMACRLFRGIHLGLLTSPEDRTTGPPSTLHLRQRSKTDNTSTSKLGGFDGSCTLPIFVHITKTQDIGEPLNYACSGNNLDDAGCDGKYAHGKSDAFDQV